MTTPIRTSARQLTIDSTSFIVFQGLVSSPLKDMTDMTRTEATVHMAHSTVIARDNMMFPASRASTLLTKSPIDNLVQPIQRTYDIWLIWSDCAICLSAHARRILASPDILVGFVACLCWPSFALYSDSLGGLHNIYKRVVQELRTSERCWLVIGRLSNGTPYNCSGHGNIISTPIGAFLRLHM